MSKSRPMLFIPPMVLALLDGTKTQARWIVKPQPAKRQWNCSPTDKATEWRCPYGEPGDTLWVRESFGARFSHPDLGIPNPHWNDLRGKLKKYRTLENLALYAMRADGQYCGGWVQANHMPRWASRITLEITSVRVERLQDISEADALAEGIDRLTYGGQTTYRNYALTDDLAQVSPMLSSPIDSYRTLYESINGQGSWDANPWVWVIEFKALK